MTLLKLQLSQERTAAETANKLGCLSEDVFKKVFALYQRRQILYFSIRMQIWKYFKVTKERVD